MTNPIFDQFGAKRWYNDKDLFHRTDGPAYIDSDGTQGWLTNGKFHRTDGPAIIWSDGSQTWYVNDQKYRDNNSYQKAAGITDEGMAMIVLKYGNVS